MMGRKFLERFRRSSPFRNAPPQSRRSKNPRRKYAKRTTRPTTQNDDGRRRIGQARRKLGRTIREIVRAVERPKLTVYPIKFKRYFNIVQQAPVNFYRFAPFFYLFHLIVDALFYLFYSQRLFLISTRRSSCAPILRSFRQRFFIGDDAFSLPLSAPN
jgi:hypothetical protein